MIENIPDFLQELNEGAVLLVDKPYGWTSFDAVVKVRGHFSRLLNIKRIKIGHAGTLDPLATGLLILCTGKKTKGIEEIQNQTKEYTGTFTLGATTPSYDLETQIDQTFPIEHITPELLQEAAQAFIGDYSQTAPAFSAKSIDGKRAYEYARKGQEVIIKPNLITIYSFEITSISLPKVEFKISCSKGTYIRTIAHDFGKKLNSGAYLASLRRTSIGDYTVGNAYQIEDLLSIRL